jgi:hypothetical protein
MIWAIGCLLAGFGQVKALHEYLLLKTIPFQAWWLGCLFVTNGGYPTHGADQANPDFYGFAGGNLGRAISLLSRSAGQEVGGQKPK